MGENGTGRGSIAAFLRAGLSGLVGDSLRFETTGLLSGDFGGMEGRGEARLEVGAGL
jgi:hypothetical protein